MFTSDAAGIGGKHFTPPYEDLGVQFEWITSTPQEPEVILVLAIDTQAW